jgi:hypothetical protein
MRFKFSLAALALAAVAAVAALLGMQIAQQAATGGVAAADQRLASLAPWLFGFRLALVAAIVGGWPWLVFQAARRFQWSPRSANAAAGLRWRVLIWFAVFELVIVQGGRIARLLGG